MHLLHGTMSGKTDFTKNEDVVRQILEQLDASVDSFATLLRLRVTCAAAKSIIDAMLQTGQEGIPQWLGMLRARTSAVTHSTVSLDLAGGAGTKEDPPIHWNLWYISRAEVFRMLQENYFVDSRFVGIIFWHMRTKVDHIIVAVQTAITHTFHEAICLFGDVCIRAMRCHIKDRDIVLFGCGMLADMESHASRDCAFIGQQLPMLTDALHHHRSDVETVSALLRFIYRIVKSHLFFRHKSISSCGVEKCNKFSAALADVMQCHMHSNAWLNIQGGVPLHYTRKACVNIACDILGQVWKIEHDAYYATSGFAKSVDALASAFRLHEGRTCLKSATNAVRLLLRRRSTGCPEVHQKVKQMVHACGLMQPTKHRKKR